MQNVCEVEIISFLQLHSSLTVSSVFHEIEANQDMKAEAYSFYHLIQKYVILGDIKGNGCKFKLSADLYAVSVSMCLPVL